VGRPSLGRQARNVNGFTKVTAEEQEWLEQAYGSMHKGLRAGLELLKSQQGRGAAPAFDRSAERSVREKKVKAAPAVRPVVPVDDDGTPIPCRIHRQFEVIAEYYDKGVPMVEKRCAKCGHVVTQRAS